jgi:GH43 family beta-xylosidase
MRRATAVVALLLAAVLLPATVAADGKRAIRNPLQINGQPLSCPDPDVFQVAWLHEWVAACTSDYGQDNPGRHANAAFPMYVSRDLRHWRFRGFIFPPGHHPWEAPVSTARSQGGRYWAPEVHRIGGRWVVYFSARIDPVLFAEHQRKRITPGTFGLFVGWTNSLFGGNWRTRLLHYTGQFNDVAGNPKENKGGVIDPSVARDPANGKLYLAWAKQNNQIFVGQLYPNGLALRERINLALGPKYSWECDPGPLKPGPGCVVEGPVLYDDQQHHVVDMFFNSASTWRGSYKIGVAVSADPMKRWVTYPKPLLRSGDGLFGPGIGAQPVVGPGGKTYVFFHVQLRPSHNSQARYLAVGRMHYGAEATMRVASPARSSVRGAARSSRVEVPQIDRGRVQRVVGRP